MSDILLGIVVLVVVYIAYKVHEINMRIVILDTRHRVLEKLVIFPADKRYEALFKLYDDVFGDIYVGDYNKIVKFGRKHDLRLPLKTMAEIEKESKN